MPLATPALAFMALVNLTTPDLLLWKVTPDTPPDHIPRTRDARALSEHPEHSMLAHNLSHQADRHRQRMLHTQAHSTPRSGSWPIAPLSSSLDRATTEGSALMVQTLSRQHPGLPLDADRHQSICRPGTVAHWGPGWSSEPPKCSDQLSRCELASRRTYSTVSQHPWCTSNMCRQQLRQQCLCRHCIEPDWGPEWSSELSKYRAQPSRTIQATQSASNTDTSILLTNSITNTNTPAETSKQSPALRGQMIWHAADRRGGESQLHSHRLHKHDMVALCRGMYRYNSNKAVKDTTTRTLKPTNSNKETEATSHSAINSDTDKQIIRKRQLVLTAMITTQGRGSWRRIGVIAQPLLLNHRKLRIQQLIQQCLCRHCSETDWGPEWSSELLKYRAQPSRRMQATQSACHSTDTSIHLTNSIRSEVHILE